MELYNVSYAYKYLNFCAEKILPMLYAYDNSVTKGHLIITKQV